MDSHNGTQNERRRKIAVVGTGISGLSAAWLLDQAHDVTVYEKLPRVGGHSHTVAADVDGREVPVDTGFMVYNPTAYPNFVAFMRALQVDTAPTDMSFAVSLGGGGFEYSCSRLSSLFGQATNLARPRFWSMLLTIAKFYREAPKALDAGALEGLSLGDYLSRNGFAGAFMDLHILPMAGAIWSATPDEIMAYPAAAFVRFFANHGLLTLGTRPLWRTLPGGSREYVGRIERALANGIRRGVGAARIERAPGHATVIDSGGRRETFDHVVLATHADEALALLAEPSDEERAMLGAFRYSRNLAVLHADEGQMPKRRSVWSSWNYVGDAKGGADKICVTYWMNKLQPLATKTDLFVTLNPTRPVREETIISSEVYHHPLFDAAAMAAQKELWRLQGERNTWFCGAYFGSGFHEDGLQSGLAVAERLGGVRRPWQVANESGRITLGPPEEVEPWVEAAE